MDYMCSWVAAELYCRVPPMGVVLRVWSCAGAERSGIWGCGAQVMREGTDITLVGFGKMVGYNLKAAELLEKEGISCEVCLCITLNAFA